MNLINIKEQKTTYTSYYRIAGHLIYVEFPSTIQADKCLSSFIPFKIALPESEEPTLRFQITLERIKIDSEQTELLSDLSIVWGDRFRFEESDEHYITTVNSDSNTNQWNMLSSKDFKDSTIHLLESEVYTTSVLSWLLMVAFGQSVLPYNTLLIHASVVEKDGEGFAFLGKSGTGKSTHSRLWINYNAGFNLLNDDNPAIRILSDGQVMVYGTPWSGKTMCYRNLAVKLKGIIRLQQSLENKFEIKKHSQAFITLLPSCSSIRWNRKLFSDMNNTVERLISLVPIAKLNCLPNKEAALLCYNHIINDKY